MMRHFPFKEYIQYRFEKFVVKGLGHQLVVLIVVFLVVYLFSFLFRMTIEFISGIERNTLRISHLLKSFEPTSLYPLEKFNVLSQLLVQSALERELESIYTTMFSLVHDRISFSQFSIQEMPFYDLQFHIDRQ